MKTDRLRELDLLRFVAAVAVVLHHFTGVRYYTPWHDATKVFPTASKFTGYGYLGVQLFFVISGFVILMSAWDRRPGEFAVSRLVRLFPAYWFGVVLVVVVYLATGLSTGYPVSKVGPIERVLPNLTMLQTGIGAPDAESVYWTLWVEIHFYALIALLVWRGITYRRAVLFMGGWLLAGVFAVESGDRLVNTLLIPQHAPYFAAGMAFFLIHRYGGNLMLWGFTAGCWALAAYYGVRYVSPFTTQPRYDDYAIPALVTAIFLVMGLVATGKLSWLRWRRLTLLGALTYPLYLVHETVARPIITVLRGQANPWAVVAFAMAVSISLAWLVHQWAELPLQRVLRPRLLYALAQMRADLPRFRRDLAYQPDEHERGADPAAGPALAPTPGPPE
jgi:peptidoglycan/LPS O-acetylase OafA/YrhL